VSGRLDGKIAVVTGAGEGQGKAVALLFAKEGAKVIAGDISGKQDDTAAEEGGGNVTPVQCDVSVPEQVEAMVKEAVSRYGRLDIMCNVAGIALHNGLIEDEEPGRWDRVQDVNLKGIFLGMKYGAPEIVKSGGGSILNWASIGGMISSGISPAYSASKAGVISLTKNAAIQYSPKGVRVNCICPGFVLTPMFGKTGSPRSPEEREQALTVMRAKSLFNRETTAEEIAGVALFLNSDEAAFITGVALPVDGGWSIRSA
jgi:NAD(P)-dependent dehydrogenase (short-subunit alcohol dehydrogenase family)